MLLSDRLHGLEHLFHHRGVAGMPSERAVFGVGFEAGRFFE
jgi:hypothetical protein